MLNIVGGIIGTAIACVLVVIISFALVRSEIIEDQTLLMMIMVLVGFALGAIGMTLGLTH